MEALSETRSEIRLAMDQFRLREALAGVIHLARLGNRYLAETEPWKLLKSDPTAALKVLRYGAELAAEMCIALEPFLPHGAQRLATQLNWTPSVEERRAWWLGLEGTAYLEDGHLLASPSLLFTPIEDATVQERLQKLQIMENNATATSASPNSSADPAKMATPQSNTDQTTVRFEDFSAMDLRLVQILEAKPVPGADKVLEIRVDLGGEQRTVVSGIAQHFVPGDLIGRQVLMLTNLAPRKIRGIESQGMLLLAENSQGKLVMVGPQGEGTAPGDRVR
jgi:methionyl-tRNA synthetase